MAPGHEGEFHLIGELLGHYRIKSAIGAGGMGEVFRATDTILGREVALKVLPAEMAANAMEWLEKAYAQKTFGVRLFLSWDCPLLRNMETDPRYQELKERVLATKLQS